MKHQPTIAPIRRINNILINEIFKSYQSEGKFNNIPALFIRVSGCNHNCSFCDENNTTHNDINIEDIISKVDYHYRINNIRLLVVTGGEPTLQYKEVQELINNLKTTHTDLIIQVESNGINWKLFDNCITCISPKKNIIGTFLNYYQNENVFFKFIIRNLTDLKIINKLVKKYNYTKTIYLQPVFIHCKEIMKMIMNNYQLLDSNYRFSFQTHKWIDVK